ncbi:hypothetical protein V8G54_028438 [Vigna mungo]|uniref:Uncharacterized protein n=1 Tax=Vigna mungo TaxID=3915 RepID=A0AAQ3MRZ4_VIGMU
MSLASVCSSISPLLAYLFNNFIFFSCTLLSISFSSSSGKCTINSLSSSFSLCLSSSTTSSPSLSISLATPLPRLLTSSKHFHSSAASRCIASSVGPSSRSSTPSSSS